MYPQTYVELRVVPAFGSERPNAMAHDLMALLVKFTHAIAARHCLKHALAFPLCRVGARPSPGNIVRVFAMDQPSLDLLGYELDQQPFVRDYISIGRVKVLRDDYQPVGFVEYRRFRVPNREKASRSRLMEIADRLPFLKTNSSTSGHGFSLHIDPIRHSSATCADDPSEIIAFEPDVYGLSVSKRRFALPLTPEDSWPRQGS